MRKTIWFSLCSLVLVSGGWGASSMPVSLVAPRFLKPNDKLPLGSLSVPDPPQKDQDQKDLEIKEAILPPPPGVMDLFTEPSLFETIKTAKKTEQEVQHFYWHPMDDFFYCHYRSLEGDHWYGWAQDGIFYYVLWRGNRYWWRDPFANLWLYYFRGVWWRSDRQDGKTLQACVEGEYYLCDLKGKVLKDMGQDGQGLLQAAPGLHRLDLWRQHQGHGEEGTGKEGDHHGEKDHPSPILSTAPAPADNNPKP